MQKEIWGSANHLQIFISGRFDKTLILSEKGDRQENPLKSLILKENGDAFSRNGSQVLPECDMNRVQMSNLCL